MSQSIRDDKGNKHKKESTIMIIIEYFILFDLIISNLLIL
jgi:hypothetical protein